MNVLLCNKTTTTISKMINTVELYEISPNSSISIEVEHKTNGSNPPMLSLQSIGLTENQVKECNVVEGKEIINFENFRTMCDILNSKISNIIDVNGSNKITLNIPTEDMNKEDLRKLLNYKLFGSHVNNTDAMKLLVKNWNNPKYQEFCREIYENKEYCSWIYAISTEDGIPTELYDITQEWKTMCDVNINYSPLFVIVPKLLYEYSIKDNSLLLYTKLKEINEIISEINFQIGQINDKYKKISFRKNLQIKLDKKGGNVKLFMEENKIEDMYEDHSGKMLTAMIQAINEIEGAEEWLLNEYINIYSPSEMLTTISNHPKVEECGHSGFSFGWTIQNTKRYFAQGADLFVYNYLKGDNYNVSL